MRALAYEFGGNTVWPVTVGYLCFGVDPVYPMLSMPYHRLFSACGFLQPQKIKGGHERVFPLSYPKSLQPLISSLPLSVNFKYKTTWVYQKPALNLEGFDGIFNI